ncbi:MAG: hypothetical protein KDD61_09375 [Bdellovibrionales bacterium]|nr:hypothetical protein [Bdellovibrionales bacterium]
MIESLLSSASAEYRAFELLIINPETGKERRVISTFDHIQYPEYHPLESGEVVNYVTSWMCWDRTNHLQKYCPKPDQGQDLATLPKPKNNAP